MRYTWDEKKNEANRRKHGLGFEEMDGFDWEMAVIIDRSRHEDGEQRFAAIGFLNDRLHTAIYTLRDTGIRLISLRRSNKPEERTYDENSY